MKIFYVDSQSYNNLGEYDKYLLENIKQEKTFFCSDMLVYKKIRSTDIRRIYMYNTLKGLKKVFSYLKSQTILLKEIKQGEPDIVHFQWFKIPFLDLLFLKKINAISRKTKIVITAHNVLPHNSGKKYVNIYRKIYLLVDRIIVHADVTKYEIVNQFYISSEKIAVIPHGLLPLKVKYPRNGGADRITFSFLGSLSNYKGLDILIDAWCNNDEILENDGIQLVIAGVGNAPCLERIPHGKNIRLENYFHSETEFAQLVSNTDVGIMPYRTISQSGVLLTYLAEHIPVIVSRIGGLTQPFEMGNVGWILKNLTSEELGGLIKDILRCPESISLIKKDAAIWERVAAFYDWKSIGHKTVDLYKSCFGMQI